MPRGRQRDGGRGSSATARSGQVGLTLDPCISLLQQLVSIDSVNPSLVPGAAGEGNIAGVIAAHMRSIGLQVHVQEVAPGRPNVIGVLEGAEPGPSLMFCGHMDTVGVDGMAGPFDPVIGGGRLYGRGSQDMKGGLAAMIDAARVVGERGLPRGRLIVAAVVDEEYASLGADALVTAWTADAAVVTEPTDLKIGIGHKGFAWFEITTRGVAAHGSRPREGRDAIVRMGRVLRHLEQLDRELQVRAPHPVMGNASLHASIIDGGRELSSYPDACRLQMERRTVEGESAQSALQEIDSILSRLRAEDPEFAAGVRLTFGRPPYELSSDHQLTRALSRAVTACGLRSQTVGMSFWTDAAGTRRGGDPVAAFRPRWGRLARD